MPQKYDSDVTDAEDRLRQSLADAFNSGALDDLSVREVRVRAMRETEKLIANDQKASIISIFIVTT